MKIINYMIKYLLNIHFIIFLVLVYLFYEIERIIFDPKWKLLYLMITFMGIANALHHWANIK